MATIFQTIDDSLKQWIKGQKLFFVATAPLADSGFINCSPKGLDTFRIIDSKTVAYQDLTGSGVETISHLKENGRILLMFCAFEGSPKIVRLHGSGEVIEPNHPEFETIAKQFPESVGTRAFIRVRLNRISDSCGYSVPLYTYKEDRKILDKWSENKGPQGISAYQQENNLRSIDDLPGLDKSTD